MMEELDYTEDMWERILVRAYATYLDVPEVVRLLDTLPQDYSYKTYVLRKLRAVFDTCVATRKTDPEDVMIAYLAAGGLQEPLQEILNDEDYRFNRLPRAALQDTVAHFISLQLAADVNDLTADYAKSRLTETEYKYSLTEILGERKETSNKVVPIKNVIADFANPDIGVGINVLPDWMNDKLKGLRRNRVTILASRPGVGKSDFSLDIIRRALKNDYRVLHVSIEMDSQEILSRMYSAVGKDGFAELVKEAKYDIMSEGRISVPQIAGVVAAGVYDLVVVDYLHQLDIKQHYNGQTDKVTILSNELRIAAKGSHAAWLVLSQFNRKVEHEHDRPLLSHLRDSGAIEQDGYAVILGYEPEKRVVVDGQYTLSRKVSWSIAKNRGGGIGDYFFRFHMPQSTWVPMSRAEQNNFEDDAAKELRDNIELSKPGYDRSWLDK